VLLRASLLAQPQLSVAGGGQAYPLFHDTLFADLRGVFTQAATARQAGSGLWAQDRSQAGLVVTGQADLEQEGGGVPEAVSPPVGVPGPAAAGWPWRALAVAGG
jgi:hypothetical protein